MITGWKSKPIGEVCTIKPPKAEARARLADAHEVSFAPMEDLGIGVKYLKPHRTRQLAEVSGSYTYFADGDVLLAKITPCFENGKLGVARGLTNGVGFGSSEYISDHEDADDGGADPSGCDDAIESRRHNEGSTARAALPRVDNGSRVRHHRCALMSGRQP